MKLDVDWFDNGHLKIAEVASVSSVDDLKKTLQVGDILYTKPRKNEGLFHKAFYAVETAVQGSPYTHVGLYVGNGKVIDAGEWKSGTKSDDSSTAVHQVDLNTFTNRYNFKVLRVAASDEVKQDAAEYAKKQLGKEFNFPGMFRLVLPFQGSPEKKDRLRKDLADSFFCSELVANAYSPVNMVAKKKLHHVMPGDIYRSTHTKTVAQFDKEAMRFSSIHSARQRLTKTAQVGTHQQETEWTCSAACLRAALMHLGYDLPEADLAEIIGAKEGRGAETTQIVEAAQAIGLDAWEQGFESLDDAKDILRQGIPIIADIQSFNYQGKGHYVLLCGFNEHGFKMMDPNTKGATAVPNWRLVPDAKMEEIWWDRAMAPPHELMPKWGVMVRDTNNMAKEAFVDPRGAMGKAFKAVRRRPIPIDRVGDVHGVVGAVQDNRQQPQPVLKQAGISALMTRAAPGASPDVVSAAIRAVPAVIGSIVGGVTAQQTGNEDSSAARPYLGALLGGITGHVGARGVLDRARNVRNSSGMASFVTQLAPPAFFSAMLGAEVGSSIADSKGLSEKEQYNWTRDGALIGAAFGVMSHGRMLSQVFGSSMGSKKPLPDFLQGAATKAEAKQRYHAAARKAHPDHGGSDEEFRGLTEQWERAQRNPNFPKTASIITNSMIEELVKIGAPNETIEAMIAGAKALGILGAGYGFLKGSDPGPGGGPEDAPGPIGGAIDKGLKGAIIGALIALGLQRNAAGSSTIPKFF